MNRDQVLNVCRMGQGADCCKFLTMGIDGFQCARTNAFLEAMLYAREDMSINCLGCYLVDGDPSDRMIEWINRVSGWDGEPSGITLADGTEIWNGDFIAMDLDGNLRRVAAAF